MIFYHFFIFLHLLGLIPTAWQESLLHPLQNDGQRIPCHGTLEEFLVCSQESLPSAHKLKKSITCMAINSLKGKILLYELIKKKLWRNSKDWNKQNIYCKEQQQNYYLHEELIGFLFN